MKLSCVLLLALAPVNAVDSQPQAANLRGIASFALSDEESAPVNVDGINFVEEGYGHFGGGQCRSIVGVHCATSPTVTNPSFKCCDNLTCQADDTVQSHMFDGKCVANGPVPAAPNTAGGRYGPACRRSGEQCNVTSASVTTKCCNDGVTYNLVCNASFGAGTCVEATPGNDFVKEGHRGWHGYQGNPNSCREIVGQSCSTSSTAPTSHKCCDNLTCQSDDTVSYPFNGKCAEATAATATSED